MLRSLAMSHLRRTVDHETVVSRETKQIPKHVLAYFVGRSIRDPEYQDGVSWRNCSQQAEECCNHGVAKSVVPSFNAWEIDDTWFVSLHFGKQLDDGSFR